MSVSVVFQVPAWIKAGLDNGVYELVGGVVRDAKTKVVVKWLRAEDIAEAVRDVGADPSLLASQAMNILAMVALQRHLGELREIARDTLRTVLRVERSLDAVRAEQWQRVVDPLRAGCELAEVAEDSVEETELLRASRTELVRGRTALVSRLKPLDTGGLLELGERLPALLDLLWRSTVVYVVVQLHLREPRDVAFHCVPEVREVLDGVAERVDAGAPVRRLPRPSEIEGVRCWKRTVEVAEASSSALQQLKRLDAHVGAATASGSQEGPVDGTSLDPPAPEGADLTPVLLEVLLSDLL